MIKVLKKQGKTIRAYRLGDHNPVLDELIAAGKIFPLDNAEFEVMSQEAVNGDSGHGQLAKTGDYIKVSSGYPYPNRTDWFNKNHRWITEDVFEQIPLILNAWTVNEPMCKEMEFLMHEKGLTIHEEDFSGYFMAPLWGTIETASKDSIVLFYSIIYDEDGSVMDAEFNFVVREEFERIYDVI